MSITVILIAGGATAVLLILAGLLIESRGKAKRPTPRDPYAESPTGAQSPGWVKAIFLLVPLGLMIIGGIVIFLGLRWKMDYDASADWPTATGTITQAEVIWEHASGIRIGNSDKDDQYKPRLEYAYTVNGHRYTNDDLYFSFGALTGMQPTYDTRSRAQRYLSGYRTNQTVAVTYNPDDPQQAVLERRFDDTAFLAGMAGGGAAVLIGLIALVWGVAQVFGLASSEDYDL